MVNNVHYSPLYTQPIGFVSDEWISSELEKENIPFLLNSAEA